MNRISMEGAILSAEALVDVSVDQAQDWFLSLQEHPEWYKFDTHEGFKFVRGSFGEVGAWFRTRERFFFLDLVLLFELTEVDDTAFWFRLIRPSWAGVWGRFSLEERGEQQARLSLSIGSETKTGDLVLRCYPVAAAVQRQISREVGHIKRSMEAVYQPRR